MKALAALVLLLPSVSAFAAPASSARLEKLFSPQTIGAPLSSVAAGLGKPIDVLGNERTYSVDGCKVLIAQLNGKVQTVAMDVSPQCNVSLNDLMRSVPPLHQMSFGGFEARLDAGNYGADCLKLCGNVSNPSVYQTWSLDTLDNPIEFRASAKLITGAAITASKTWGDRILKEKGMDYVIDNEFNCNPDYDAQARLLFRDIRITRIEMGYVRAERCAAG